MYIAEESYYENKSTIRKFILGELFLNRRFKHHACNFYDMI